LGPAEAFDVHPAVGVAQGGAQGQDDLLEQQVAFAAVQAGVGKIYKEGGKKLQGVAGRHPSPPGSGLQRRSIVRQPIDGVKRPPNNPGGGLMRLPWGLPGPGGGKATPAQVVQTPWRTSATDGTRCATWTTPVRAN